MDNFHLLLSPSFTSPGFRSSSCPLRSCYTFFRFPTLPWWPEIMASSGFSDTDIHIASSSFIATGLLYEYTHGYLERKLSKWDCFPQTLRNRMCIEIACIPVRIGLVYFSLPSVLLAFTPASNWSADDTQRSLIAWFVLPSLPAGSSLLANIENPAR